MSNLYLLSPEISLLAVALMVIFFDLLLGRRRVLGWISAVGLLLPFVFTITLWGTNDTAFGGALVVDQFSLFFKLFFLVTTALVIFSSINYSRKFAPFRGEFYALMLLATTGMMLLASTRELISIFVALELTGIPLYVLSGFLRDEKSSEAGLKYLLLGAVASAVLLYGMAMVFGLTGTTYLDKIAMEVFAGRLVGDAGLLMAIVLLVAGFGFKLATVPFQMWVPDVYEGAPTPITAYLSVASKAAGFAVVVRIFYEALGPASVDWSMIFAVLAAFTMTIGNVVALAQSNIKRLLGYSSIAHAGYLMIGLAAATSTGSSAVVFYLGCYAVMNLGAFIAIIAISNRIGSDEIADYSGMAKRSPLLAAALALCLISLTGIPPTAGFMAKLYIFNAGVDANLIWLVIVGVLNAVIAAYYYLRIVKLMYLGEPVSEERVTSTPSLSVALAVACLGVLVLGIYPWVVLRVAESATSLFLP